MSTYLDNALDGWTRPDKETNRVRAGAFVLSLEQVRRRGDWTPDQDGQQSTEQWDRHTFHCSVRSLVYDAFAYLATEKGYGSDHFYRLEALAYAILTGANEGDEKAMISAADAMAALTPYWAKSKPEPWA